MILLRITTKREEQIKEIAEILLREYLAMDLNLKTTIKRLSYESDELREEKLYLLTAKTKAILFPVIDKRLLELYPDEMPEIYSLPIVHMDWEQATELDEGVA